MTTLERWIEGRQKGLNAYQLNAQGIRADWQASWYLTPPRANVCGGELIHAVLRWSGKEEKGRICLRCDRRYFGVRDWNPVKCIRRKG